MVYILDVDVRSYVQLHANKIPNLLDILPGGWIADPQWDRNVVEGHLGLQQI